MGIIKGLIFIIVYFSSLSVLYLTEYNTIAFVFILALSVTILFKLEVLEKRVCSETSTVQTLQDQLINQKNYFAETLLHDLKVPTIAQLRGLELLKHETIGTISYAQEELISQIEHSCKYVLEMISMILTTYKYELKEYVLSYEEISISELVLESFIELSEDARKRGVRFSYISTSDKVIVEADRGELKKAIKTLLSAVILYSNKGEVIMVNLSLKDELIKFSIILKSRTLSSQECATMFEYNYFEGIPKYTNVGQDISLYLVKKIIDSHCGAIYASAAEEELRNIVFIIPQYRIQSTFEEPVAPVLAAVYQ